jgi:hypothetical protein
VPLPDVGRELSLRLVQVEAAAGLLRQSASLFVPVEHFPADSNGFSQLRVIHA